MPVERRQQLCFLKMNIEVHFAHPLWYILLQKPLHSSITHQWAAWYPVRCNAAWIGAPQFRSALLSLDWRSSISFRTWFPFPRSSIPVGAPQPWLTLFDFIPHSIPLSPLLNSRQHSLAKIDSLLFHSALNSPPPFRGFSIPTGAPRAGLSFP